MTFKRFILLGFLLWLLLAALKLLFFRMFDSAGTLNQAVYYAATLLITVACGRRLGVINYLEAATVALLWMLAVVIGDTLVTVLFSGGGMFKTLALWISYVLVGLGIFFFHKKRHVHIRKQMAAHHGHH